MAKTKKIEELEQQLGELTLDLQRTRADFENYRKRVDDEKAAARQLGEAKAILGLLPIIDTLDRAINHIPEDLKDNSWVSGVGSLGKKLDKMLSDLKLERIAITPGETEFDPELHEAISADDAEGEREIVSEELQSGYLHDGRVLRHAMVRVTRQ